MAMDQKNEKDTQGKRKSGEKRGFYIALAVCLAAIGIAAWNTALISFGYFFSEKILSML